MLSTYPAILALAIAVLNTNMSLAAPAPHSDTRPASAGDAYTGVGGQAPGGSINNPSLAPNSWSLLDILSDNAGDGGVAKSGDSEGGDARQYGRWSDHDQQKGGSAGDAYSGAGGQAPGGSVNNPGSGIIRILSGNAGDGGLASSGDGKGGDL